MNEDIVEQIALLLTNREKYQRSLGQLSLEYRKQHGSVESLKGLAEDIKERHGLTISWKTLHNYAWVEERLSGFEIPEDITFRLRQALAGTKNPKEWVDKINSGAPVGEIYEGIRGKRDPVLIECPKCHFAFEKPTYIEAHAKAKEITKDFKY